MTDHVVVQRQAERETDLGAHWIHGRSGSAATTVRWARMLRAAIATLKVNPKLPDRFRFGRLWPGSPGAAPRFSDPTKTLHKLIMARKIRQGGNPIRRWHATHAIARRDAAGNIKLDKEKSRRNIDGMAALVNAVGAAILHPPEPPRIY